MLPLEEKATARLRQTKSRLTEFTACFRENVKGVMSVRSVTKGLVACASGGRRQCFGANTSRSEVMSASVGLIEGGRSRKLVKREKSFLTSGSGKRG
jgi:hypothetical protein